MVKNLYTAVISKKHSEKLQKYSKKKVYFMQKKIPKRKIKNFLNSKLCKEILMPLPNRRII